MSTLLIGRPKRLVGGRCGAFVVATCAEVNGELPHLTVQDGPTGERPEAIDALSELIRAMIGLGRKLSSVPLWFAADRCEREHGRRLQPTGRPPRSERDEVGDGDRHRHPEQKWHERHMRIGYRTQVPGEERPDRSTGGDTDRHADGQCDAGEDGRLPCNSR